MYRVKDRVKLKNNQKGMIIGIDPQRGRYRILLARDWETGRTRFYNPEDMTRLDW